jgi:hypothetical protein
LLVALDSEIAPGVKVDTSMTPEQRFEIIKANIANVAPPQFHTDGTVARMTQGDTKAPPPSQAALKAPPPPVNDSGKVAAFDAEMRAKGLQRAPDGAFQPAEPVEIDQAALDVLNKTYRALSPAEREAKRGVYENDLRTIYEDRRNGESLAAFRARQIGTSPAALAQDNGEAALNLALDVATRASNKYGFAPREAITGPLLHGYTLPPNREYHVAELAAGLRLARAGNLSQAQVDAIIAKSNVI